MAAKIRSRRHLAYNTASKLHSIKFLKQLINLRNLDNASTSNNSLLNPTNTAPNRENTEINRNTTDNTDLTGQLNTQEINLLSKGPKFSLSLNVSEHTVTGINIAFFRLANQMRWKQLHESNPYPSNVITHPQTRHI